MRFFFPKLNCNNFMKNECGVKSIKEIGILKKRKHEHMKFYFVNDINAIVYSHNKINYFGS